MYTLAVQRKFVAQHFLTVPNCGAENDWHSHHYILEVRLAGEALNQYGYVVDITDVEHHLDEIVAEYKDKTLNDRPAFAGLNPSIEHFARIICEALIEKIDTAGLSRLRIRLWENDIAWAAYEQEIK